MPTPISSSSAIRPTGEREYVSSRCLKGTHCTGRNRAVQSIATASLKSSNLSVYSSGKRAE